jgi:hypothetical protein
MVSMNTTQTKVMAEATTVDGQYLMSRGRRDTVLVSREYAWADVKAWQQDSRINYIQVRRAGEIVWSWRRP